MTTPDRAAEPGGHLWPSFLPDGRRFTFLAVGAAREDLWVCIGSLDSPEVRRILPADSGAIAVPPGRLLFLREGTLLAQDLDAGSLDLAGDPIPIAEKVSRNTDTLYSAFTASAEGALVFKSGADSVKQFAWFDRSGRRTASVGPQGDVGNPAISPDGGRLAVDRVEPNAVTGDVWVIDLARGTGSRLTFEPENEATPVWSRDGGRLFFWADRDDRPGIYAKAANGATAEQLVVESKEAMWLQDLSPDGSLLVFVTGSVQGDIGILPLTGDRAPRPFLRTPFEERRARLSPDGRWIAYDSDESGATEIYVQSFPDPGGKWQVSTRGGVEPMWRADGKELFYLAPDRTLMAVPVSLAGAAFDAGTPQPLFPTELPVRFGKARFGPAPDGQRFLVAVPEGDAGPAPIQVVLHWDAAMGRRAP